MIDELDFTIAAHLRRYGRENLTTMSRSTAIPVSTIYDRMKLHEGKLFCRYTVLLDYARLGYQTRACIFVKAGKNQKDNLKEYLLKHSHVNSVSRVNNGFDFMVETIFRTLKDMEDFLTQLETTHGVKNPEIHYVIEDLKRETFLTNPNIVQLLIT